MSIGHDDLAGALDCIDPATLGYDEWLAVGMGLHAAGLDVKLWDDWSRRDMERFKEGECARKWAGFGHGDGEIGPGTVAKMAYDRGWDPHPGDRGTALEWDGEVQVVDPSWVEPVEIPETDADPARQLAEYIGALFEPDEHVGYCCESREVDGGRRVPANAGSYARTAAEIIADLERYGTIEDALGDYDRGCGAWIRFNPLDGRGARNANVTAYRYALVESDSMPKDRQLAIIQAMNLPCAAIVDSGNKSVHAIVKIEAADYDEYRERVNRLYEVCRKNGLEPDTQNKNPSRLSRMPGAARGGSVQSLLSLSCGAGGWQEWTDWLAENADDLPEDTNEDWDEPIRLAPPLIGTEGAGVLRCGQKMVLAGQSKAGKSYALIDLAEAIACGGTWMGWPCLMGPVYYINLEIADESFRARQHAVWDDRDAHGDVGAGLAAVKENFVRLDLRGRAQDMGRLAPVIVRRVLKRGPRGSFRAVIVDPIYKVNGGDENDAAAISRFTNSLDLVASKLGCAVIYAHHHAKGAMGQRRSMDRMSGSGVFARDADAILDLTQIEVDEDRRAELLGDATAWRMTATLREFRSPEPIDLVFKFPRFYRDETGALRGYEVEGADPFKKQIDRNKKNGADNRRKVIDAVSSALSSFDRPPDKWELMEALDERLGYEVTEDHIKKWSSARWCPLKAYKDGSKWRYRNLDDEIAGQAPAE